MLKTILIVDDEQDLLTLIETRLKTYGFNVLTALNGEEGFRKAKEEKPDLILLDILMPIVDGVTMAANLRKDENTKKIPIVFLTSLVNEEEIQQKHKVGGEAFLAKPFEIEEMMSVIQKKLKQ